MHNTESRLLVKSANIEVAAELSARIQANGFLSFEIHDNGGRPFLVQVHLAEKRVTLLKRNYCSEPSYEELPSSQMFSALVDEVWCGCGTYDDLSGGLHYSIGNTVIAIAGGTVYVFAGMAISFDLLHAGEGEKVTKYVSTVCNSDVPYAWIETNRGIYVSQCTNCNNNDMDFLAWEHFDGNVMHKSDISGRQPHLQNVSTVKIAERHLSC
jgi:hypothetical protein